MRSAHMLGIGAVLILGCNPDSKVGVRHEPPAVTIAEPSDQSEFSRGEEVVFKALVSTLDGSELTDLTHTWVTGNTSMCASDVVPGDGMADCKYIFDEIGEASVTVTVVDPQLDSVSNSITVTIVVNEPPEITIVTPEEDDVYEPTDLIILEANVNDAEDLPDRLAVSVTSSVDGQLPLLGAPTSDGVFSVATYLTHGLHLLTFIVEDTAGQTAQDSVSIGVNGRPTAPSVSVIPDPAASGDALQATLLAESVDPDGDLLTYTYDWYVDSVLFSSGSNINVPSGVTIRDEFWEVRVTPHDDFGPGHEGMAFVIISNSAPSIDSVTIVPSVADTNEDLIGLPTGWMDQDLDPEKYKFLWYTNQTPDLAEITDTFPHSKTSRGDEIQLEVTPYDSYDSGAPVLSPPLTIENAPPSKPVIQIDPPGPGPDSDLQCQILLASTDPDGDVVTYEYEWYQNGLLTTNNTSKVLGTDTVVGDAWECHVLPYDGDYGPEATATVIVSDVVAPDAPTIDAIDPYRNVDEATLTGTCEIDCDISIYCEDSTQSWTETDICNGIGEFTHDLDLTPGETTSCFLTCEDDQGNLSANSNTVITEACAVKDTFEDASGYGDLPQDAVDQWGQLVDDGATIIVLEGNILDFSDEDWFFVETTDDLSADETAGIDYYNFVVDVTDGSSVYSVLVYRGGYDTSDIECPSSTTSGYSSYSDFNEDVGNSDHAQPTDSRDCGAPLANDCTDYSSVYYIQVLRDSAQSLSCQHYELTISNGVWP
ncbi:MAG: hypothetical protein HN348_10370 [Proteobacteria bacterium]|jgi:hypothetical protein|nr:hypothetical protein [Pseudomonadota bacterium]